MGLVSNGSNLGRELHGPKASWAERFLGRKIHGPKALWSENAIRILYKLSTQSMDMLPTSRLVVTLVVFG